jgi:uncharacterized protein YjbI with pentapeptide repeats
MFARSIFLLFIISKTQILLWAYNPEHLENVKKYRICIKCNLTDAEIVLGIHKTFNLEESWLIRANIGSKNNIYNRTKNNYSNFKNTNLLKATLSLFCRNCDFTQANMSYTELYGDYTGSKFAMVNFDNSYMVNVNFSNADFTDASFHKANLERAIFFGSNITEQQLKSAEKICGVILPNGDEVMCD